MSQPVNNDGTQLMRLRRPATSQRWITRRVDRLELIDHATIVRTVSLDLNLADSQVKPDLVRRGGCLLLPLARLSRVKHATITACDESGAVLPRLNMDEERALGLQVLRQTARTVLHKDPDDTTAARIVEVLYRRRTPEDFNDHVVNENNEPTTEVGRLAANTGFMGLLANLYANYYLMVLLPERDVERRVVTYRYEEQPRLRDPGTGARPQRSGLGRGRRLARLVQNFIRHAVWPTTGLWMLSPCENIEETRSYHAEVRAPYDVELHDATLIAPLGADGEMQPVRDDNQSLTGAHMFVSPPMRPLEGAFIDARLVPVTTGIVRSTTLVSVVLALILGAGLWYATRVSAHDLFAHPDRSSATAVLLLAPTVLAAVLAAPSRHSMTTRLLWETRITVAFSCLAMFSAAAAVALRVEQKYLVNTLLASVILATLSMIRLITQWVRIYRSRGRTRAWLRAQLGPRAA